MREINGPVFKMEEQEIIALCKKLNLHLQPGNQPGGEVERELSIDEAEQLLEDHMLQSMKNVYLPILTELHNSAAKEALKAAEAAVKAAVDNAIVKPKL